MTSSQLLGLSMPVIALVFMGAIAWMERRSDRAPARTPDQAKSAHFLVEVQEAWIEMLRLTEEAGRQAGKPDTAKDIALLQIGNIARSVGPKITSESH